MLLKIILCFIISLCSVNSQSKPTKYLLDSHKKIIDPPLPDAESYHRKFPYQVSAVDQPVNNVHGADEYLGELLNRLKITEKAQNKRPIVDSADKYYEAIPHFLSSTDKLINNQYVTGDADESLNPLKKLPQNDGRIVGGVDAYPGEFPYQLSVEFGTKHFCGASLLSPTYAVTACHCVRGVVPNGLRVRAGSIYKERLGQILPVKKTTCHRKYSPTTQDSDIAIIEFAVPVTISEMASPVRLPDRTDMLPDDTTVDVTGWGKVTPNYFASGSDILQKIKLTPVDFDKCNTVYGGSLTNHMICAIGDGRDSCQGDSGGPLTVNGVLYGIVSFGNGCARPGIPGVYTNLVKFRTWIYLHTGI